MRNRHSASGVPGVPRVPGFLECHHPTECCADVIQY